RPRFNAFETAAPCYTPEGHCESGDRPAACHQALLLGDGETHPVQLALCETEQMLAWLLSDKVDADVKPPTTNRNVQYSLLDVRGWLGLPGSHDVERTKAERPLCASVVRGRATAPDGRRRHQCGVSATGAQSHSDGVRL